MIGSRDRAHHERGAVAVAPAVDGEELVAADGGGEGGAGLGQLGEPVAEPPPGRDGVEGGAGALVLGRGPRPHLGRGAVLEPAVRVGDLDPVEDLGGSVGPRGRRAAGPGQASGAGSRLRVAAAVGLAAVVGLLLASPVGGLLRALRHRGATLPVAQPLPASSSGVRARRMQNSLPSGSASTTHVCRPGRCRRGWRPAPRPAPPRPPGPRGAGRCGAAPCRASAPAPSGTAGRATPRPRRCPPAARAPPRRPPRR